MSDYLPPELWSKIFLKLPIRFVIQCTAVCKQWRSIITSSAFISAHLCLSRQNPLLLTPPTTITPNIFSLHFDTDDSPLRLSQILKCPFLTYRKNYPFQVVGSVDGLVLLSDDILGNSYTTILWNPSIRKSVTLPMPRFNSESLAMPHYDYVLGFGLDSASGDYKVVRVVYPDDFGPPPPLLVEVYSLRDRRWRTVISSIAGHLPPPYSWTQCFIHGAVHWIGLKTTPGHHEEILLFDVGTEEFNKMALPRVEIAAKAEFSILVVGGLLAVSVLRSDWTNQTNNINIWVKTDYYADSWTKIASLDAWKLRVWEWLDLRRVCWEIPTGTGVDCRDIQVHPVATFMAEKTFLDDYVFSYTESLILLDGEDRAVQEAR